MMFLPRLVALLLCLVGFASGAAVLPPEEVATLRRIATTLKKTNWNFDVDPCSGLQGWVTQMPMGNESAVDCACHFQNFTICHVINITLKSQDLTGLIPREIVELPFLQSIDLTRNYLNGTIPPEWGSMNLTRINLLGNRITGPIPKEIANISTLIELVVEFNQLSGSIPPELGNLPRIERLLFSSNNLTGEIPEDLAKLTTLKDLRLNDNNFNGSIFIGNWTNMERLEIQASGLSGPIPLGIASLTALNNLRISDLNGNQSTNFPPSLSNLRNLQYLILRSCNIVGQLPNYLGRMTGLKLLDLSFNKLSGPIPDSYSRLSRVDYIYLTGNSLNGPVPPWMLTYGGKTDLSYNNFTDSTNITSQNSGSLCPSSEQNLFAFSKGNTSGIVSCLKRFQCPRDLHHSVHINCGGRQETDEGTTYEDDINAGGPSNFFPSSKSNWACSSTGHFLNDDERPTKTFIPENTSSIVGENPRLYMNARISPLSLTYYGFCLSNGNYTVNLHFAEIMFYTGNTFRSLGRRIFDVYIQGKLVLKDFNIEKEAGGVNRGIIRNFTAVVNDKTIDIRFYWAGKGTSGIPYRSIYGPLISAISVVDPNYTPPPSTAAPEKNFATGAIVGIVVGVIFAVLLFVVTIWWKCCFKRKDTLENELKGLDLHTGSFTLRQIKAATNNFDPANKIGEGGFGPVYKGLLLDGTIIAVKQLSSKSKQGNREFVNEIGMISALQHPHLVKLYGCCIEGNQLLLIYEYLENNSLARALFGPEEHQLHLDWPTRQKISIGIARGLAYLHEESRLKIVHRDIKATNVLLDKNLMPKISDFGLAKLDEEDDTHISTRIAGTFGYMAPEYAMRGYLTDKADVYSFGVVLLEIVCGRSNSCIKPKEESFYLLDWANSLKAQGNLTELVDPRLGSNFNQKQVITAINLALLCTNAVAAERPSMSSVVSILEGKGGLNEFDSDLYISTEKTNTKEMEDEYRKGKSTSVNIPWTASTASTADLYPITVDTEYWEKRDQ